MKQMSVASEPHNCDVNALCINNNVSFSCECLPGFNGTGTNGTCSGNIC